MKGFAVNLRDDGLFEASSAYPGESSVRIMHDSSDRHCPWVALTLDPGEVKWMPLKSFHSLDDALDFAVGEVNWDRELHEYTVRIPDGMSFRRPGRLPAEQVMASAGWYFVTSLIGYVMMKTPHDGNAFDVRSELSRRLEGKKTRIGDVDLSDRDEEGLHWCIDLNLPYEGFIHVDDVEAEARAAFAVEGVEVIPNFNFQPRTNVAMQEASVIAFPEDRIVRRLTAA